MPEYRLEEAAELDLLEIGRYTVGRWGVDQAVRYLSAFDGHFEALAAGDAFEKAVFEHREDFRVSRCQHHYVFFVREDDDSVLILAVLHENMDMVERFRDRLGDLGRADA